MKLHIFGASGSGTTTLGEHLAAKLRWKHLDTDDYYWKPTDPPYLQKIPLSLRTARITSDFKQHNEVIISGSMVSWGKQWESVFDLAVFLYIPHAIRMERLRKREFERYGNVLTTDKAAISRFEAFLGWASRYDDETFDGRSISTHQKWMDRLNCPILRIEGDTTITERMDLVLDKIKVIGHCKGL